MESSAIVKQPINLSTWQMIREAAPVMYKSRLFGIATEEQAMAIMAKGFELGLGLTSSFEFIQVVLGKPTLIPRGALALAYQSGELESLNISEANDENGQPYSCTVSGRRRGGSDYTLTFSLQDARRAGLLKPGSGWESYPANMLKWRAVGFWLDVVLPDVQGGMKRADEFGATVDAGGNIIDALATNLLLEPATQGLTSLDELIETHGVERVMEAINTLLNGALPAGQTELLALKAHLEG